MGPKIADSKNCQSSDEEDYVRHDRFYSERFKEDSVEAKPSKFSDTEEKKYIKRDRYRNNDHHRRSPIKYQSYDSNSSSSTRTAISSSSSSSHSRRYMSSSHSVKRTSSPSHSGRSKNDKKDREKEHVSSKSKKKDKHSKKYSKDYDIDNTLSPRPKKMTLSSILENFDKNLKRNNTELPTIGPSLPSDLNGSCEIDSDLQNNSKNTNSVIGPVLPTILSTISDDGNDMVENKAPSSSTLDDKGHDLNPDQADTNDAITPQNLQHDLNKVKLEVSSSLKADSKVVVLGPSFPDRVEDESFGPALPPNFKKDNIQGPKLPEGITADRLAVTATEIESEDEEMVGPLPEGEMNLTQLQLDLRKSQIKRKLEEEKSGKSSSDVKQREEWMLELPSAKAANLGLGPRSFRMREAPDMSDRSSWTDTPADKLRKMEQSGEPKAVDMEEVRRSTFIKERDEAMDKMCKKSKDKDRAYSLLEMHQKKLKKKKKKEHKEGKKKERRPFDRNIDLQANRFDDAQKKAIFKKAQLLDSRFSSGESKYL